MIYKDINQVINLHKVSESTTAQDFLHKQVDRLNNPVCKHCGEHTEKFRITNKKGNVCGRCQKYKGAIQAKIWYYKKKGWKELVSKMNLEYNKYFSGSIIPDNKITV